MSGTRIHVNYHILDLYNDNSILGHLSLLEAVSPCTGHPHGKWKLHACLVLYQDVGIMLSPWRLTIKTQPLNMH